MAGNVVIPPNTICRRCGHDFGTGIAGSECPECHSLLDARPDHPSARTRAWFAAGVLFASPILLLFVRPLHFLAIVFFLAVIAKLLVPDDSDRYRVTRRATAPATHAMVFAGMSALVAILAYRLNQYLHTFIEWVRFGPTL
jgi:hypothetical protein